LSFQQQPISNLVVLPESPEVIPCPRPHPPPQQSKRQNYPETDRKVLAEEYQAVASEICGVIRQMSYRKPLEAKIRSRELTGLPREAGGNFCTDQKFLLKRRLSIIPSRSPWSL
jgi:hypothetical protein